LKLKYQQICESVDDMAFKSHAIHRKLTSIIVKYLFLIESAHNPQHWVFRLSCCVFVWIHNFLKDMSAVKEEILEELEVLRAIYDLDFEDRPSTWQNVPSFAIRVLPTKNSVNHHNAECFVIGLSS